MILGQDQSLSSGKSVGSDGKAYSQPLNLLNSAQYKNYSQPLPRG